MNKIAALQASEAQISLPDTTVRARDAFGIDTDMVVPAFAHRAVFDESFGRIEMQLVSRRAQRVRIGESLVAFDDGEVIVTEYSHKYTIDGFAALLASAGFDGGDRLHRWCDARGWFGVFLAEPA